MVVLSPNFTILASMSVVAVMTMLPTADAVAINKSGNSASVQPGHGLNGGTSTSPDVKGTDALPVGAASPGDITDGVTSIPLPSTRRRSEDNGVGAHRLAERYWTHDQKLNAVSKWWLNGNSPERRASHDGGDVQHENVHRRSPSPEPHRHHHDEVIVSGNDDHVRMRRSPSPEPRHHHHHDDYHHAHEKVIVSGDDDHVNMRRAPRSKYRHHFHGHRRSILSSRVPKETITSLNKDGLVIVSTSERDSGKANEKRQETAFSEPEGVPGRIDVMSTVAGSSEGQLIASLVVDLVQGNSTNSSSPQLVLDASQTDQTEVYLVALSDCTGSSSSGSANSTGPADPSDSSASSSSITSFNFDSPSTPPSNSSTSSCSASSTHKKVALKIPVFDPKNASMMAYCATFDPQPQSPSPLTVESCAAGAITTERRSQVFDYDTLTGVIRPLWYEDVPTDDDGSADGTDAPAGNSTATDVGSSSDTVDTMARIADLSSKLVARSPYSDAQNVTLVFTPASVIIAPPDSSSSSSTVSSTASASSIVSTSTASDYEYTTTFATFSPAAAPTSSSSDAAVSSDFASTTVVFSPAAATPIFATPSTMSASSTLLASATTSSSSATHSLGVEVFDPDAMPTSASDSSSGSATTSAPSDPTMTPVSTASAPYEWMFREGSVKNKRS